MIRNTRRGAIPSELGWLIDELNDTAQRIQTLESGFGGAVFLAQLKKRVEALEESVAAVPALIDQRVNAAVAAAFAGAVTITGSLTVNGALAAASLTTAGALATSGPVTLPGARATTIPASGATGAVFDATGKVGRAA